MNAIINKGASMLRHVLDNWITSIVGVLAIIGAVAGGLNYVLTADPVSFDGLKYWIGMVMAGVAAMSARDGSPPLTEKGKAWRDWREGQ